MTQGYPFLEMCKAPCCFPVFIDANNQPMSGGMVSFFSDKEESKFLDTYQDIDLTIKNTNPVILDAKGAASAEIFLKKRRKYYFQIRDAEGIIWSSGGPIRTGK